MRTALFLATAVAAVLLTGRPASAEPYATYDNFSASPLDPSRWVNGERVRLVKGGTLNLMQRNWNLTTADSGAQYINFDEGVSNPSAVTQLKAKIIVNAVEVDHCPANPTLGQSRARIVASYFNIGSPVPGSQVGDVQAQVRLTRYSNSIDAPGVLRVQGLAWICNSSDCLNTTLIGSVIDLGTVAVGQAAVVQLQWNKSANRFVFSRDSGAFSGSATYTQTDASPPSVAFATLSTRVDVPSCTSGPRISGMVDATFDNVAVNASAVP